jgi:DNA-binding XRE family transcriptional regulator
MLRGDAKSEEGHALGVRLRRVRETLQLTGEQMAALVEVSRGYWSAIENGKVPEPGKRVWSALKRQFQIDRQLLDSDLLDQHVLRLVLDGHVSKLVERSASSAHLPAAHKSASGSSRPVRPYTRRVGETGAFAGVMEPSPSGQIARSSTVVRFGGMLALPAVFEVVQHVEREYVVIPSIEVAARAGTASSMKAEQERIAACMAGVMAMDRAWMSQQLGREDGGFATITVTGNSMLPTLHDGDTIIIDTMVTTIDTDGIYVLRRGAQLVIKRIKVLMDESAIVSGDNEAYGPGEKLQPASLRELRAVGRMVWPRLR